MAKNFPVKLVRSDTSLSLKPPRSRLTSKGPTPSKAVNSRCPQTKNKSRRIKEKIFECCRKSEGFDGKAAETSVARPDQTSLAKASRNYARQKCWPSTSRNTGVQVNGIGMRQLNGRVFSCLLRAEEGQKLLFLGGVGCARER